MSLLNKARNVAVAILDPNYHAKTAEADEIRQRHSAQGGILKNQWYRLANLNNQIVGLSFVCDCRKEVQFLNLFEWLIDYECPQCRVRYELLKAIGLGPDSPISELAAAVATLPIRQRAAGAPQPPRFLDTWSSSDDGVDYEKTDPGAAGFGVGFGGH